MKYWNEKVDQHIRLAETDVYQSYPSLTGRINKNGYIDEELKSSDVIYMGTCDIMSAIPDRNQRWAKLLHDSRTPDAPFITIGSPAAGFPSVIRRLNSYIHHYGPPKTLYLTIARFEGYEYVNKSGKCYNVNSRAGTPRFLKKRNLLTDKEFEVWNLQIDAYKNLYNIENNRYLLEERFVVLELLCKMYKIELRWGFNLSDACIVALHHNIEIFNDISDFMKQSFVGLSRIKGMLPDRSMNSDSHYALFEQFYNPQGEWNYDNLCEISKINYQWLFDRFGHDLIKNEN